MPVKADLVDPAMNNPSVLPGAEMGATSSSTREDVIFRPQATLFDPVQKRLPGALGHLELDRSLGLLLHYDRPALYAAAVAQILHA